MTNEYGYTGKERPRCVPKLMGADEEQGNAIEGLVSSNGTGREASRALLREIEGVSGTPDRPAFYSDAFYSNTGFPGLYTYGAYSEASLEWEDPQDVGRKYLASNGGCVYIDLDHLEICTPEVLSARDFVAARLATLRIVREALEAANARQPPGQRILVLVNSSDGLGHAYGSHLNFLITRRLWDDLFRRRLHPELFLLAAYQVSSIVCSGQGKVGSENGRPEVAYQISQRSDFINQLVGPQTTYDRPIVNSRDEPLCGVANMGPDGGLARLHCIFYDATLCQVGTLLKVGVMQILLSMLEAQWLDSRLILEDPVIALTRYSHDPGLSARALLADGRRVTAAELQSLFCEQARAYVDAGCCEGLVPDAAFIIELWEDTLDKLLRQDFDALAPRLDWVLKKAQIERALANRGLDWSSPEAKHLDHLYASLEDGEGLFWIFERAGLVQKLVPESRIEHFRRTPPSDTRAWTRAMLLRQLPPDRIRRVDWDRIELARTGSDTGKGPLIVRLDDPLGHTSMSGFPETDSAGTKLCTAPERHSDDTDINRGDTQP